MTYASLTFNNAKESELEARDVCRASAGGNFTLRTVSLLKGESTSDLESRGSPLYEELAPMYIRILACPEVHVVYLEMHAGWDIPFLMTCRPRTSVEATSYMRSVSVRMRTMPCAFENF
jgi:hypothetical protein